MSEPMREQVVAVRRWPCQCDESTAHITGLKLKSGGELSAYDAIELLKAGAEIYMIPPPGAPAHEAHMVTRLPLILQYRMCQHCKTNVLFA